MDATQQEAGTMSLASLCKEVGYFRHFLAVTIVPLATQLEVTAVVEAQDVQGFTDPAIAGTITLSVPRQLPSR